MPGITVWRIYNILTTQKALQAETPKSQQLAAIISGNTGPLLRIKDPSIWV
jgi:hypothetical protein